MSPAETETKKMTTLTENQTIAATILEQLGGTRRLSIMAGCKNFVAIDNGLTFKIGRNSNGVTHMTVRLTADDTYDVLFQRVHGVKVTEKSRCDGAFCDMLVDLFESATGMYLSL